MRKNDITIGKAGEWPLAIRLEVLPGDSIEEKFGNAAEFGFDAVELPGRTLDSYLNELRVSLKNLPIPVSSISLGFRGSLIADGAKLRAQCREDVKKLFDLCATLGAVGLVMPPVLHQDRYPRLRKKKPSVSVKKAEDKLLVSQLPELLESARQNNVLLLLEPVNRYETDYLNTLAQATAFCEKMKHPALGITADYYHMQLEELHPLEALKAAGAWVRHVHIAEYTRVEPGHGHMNFRALFKALREINYHGYIVVECRTLTGEAQRVLPDSARFLRGLLNEVKRVP
jgi:sugar phosphate isomerase/epimerase